MVSPDENDRPVYETFSEKEIIEMYWPYWYKQMCKKYGKAHVDSNYTRKDCVEDWVVIHWAWPAKDSDVQTKRRNHQRS